MESFNLTLLLIGLAIGGGIVIGYTILLDLGVRGYLFLKEDKEHSSTTVKTKNRI